MSSPFRNRSTTPPSRPSSAKFPFIHMPITKSNPEVQVRVTVSDDSMTKGKIPHQNGKMLAESASKASRRNEIIHKELRARFPQPHEPYIAHEQLSRRQNFHRGEGESVLNKPQFPIMSQSQLFAKISSASQPESYEESAWVSSNNCPKFRLHKNTNSKIAEVPLQRTPSKKTVCSKNDEDETLIFQLKNLQYQIERVCGELLEKDKEIETLKKELSDLKEVFTKTNYETDGTKVQCSNLMLEVQRVEQQLENLEERFDNEERINSFKDYILSSPHLNLSNNSINNSQHILPNESINKSNSSPDFDKLISMIRELNLIAGSQSSSMELCFSSSGATFRQPASLLLTLFKNGLSLDEDKGEFRPFKCEKTGQFLQDIYDGYFPTELQSKYPDGITLIVKDRRHVFNPEEFSFEGIGKKLNERSVKTPTFYPGMRWGQKLKTPPKVEPVIKTSNNVQEVESNENFSNKYKMLPDLLTSSKCLTSNQRMLYKTGMKKTIVLKLRNLATEDVYKMNVTLSATPSDITEHLEKSIHLEKEDDFEGDDDDEKVFVRFELINCLPFGTFSAPDATLREYGIITNSLIYFRPIK